MNKKRKIFIIVAILIVVIAIIIMANNINKSNEIEEIANFKQITINVFDKENNEIYTDLVNTDDTYLADTLEEIDTLEVEMEDSEYGKYITSIMGIEQGDNYYWSYYINDEYAEVGVSNCKLEDNAVYSFKIEKYEY